MIWKAKICVRLFEILEQNQYQEWSLPILNPIPESMIQK